MKTFSLIFLLVFASQLISAQNLKPYILGIESSDDISVVKEKIEAELQKNSLEIVGQYQPAADKNRWIIVFSSSELKEAVIEIGRLTGFASTLRVGITNEDGKTIVSYTNPAYWGNAYFRDDFEKVSSNYSAITTKLKSAMEASGSFVGTQFGSEKGVSSDDLHKYRYMFGMPRFEDTVELSDFGNYKTALARIESTITRGVPNVNMVYKLDVPGKDLTLYGFALSGDDGEEKFLPTIDINNPKHTAFLPYEVLVKDGQVLMLHGRYRIALSFPDLTMGTFSKIMSTPGNIEELLKQIVK